MFLRAASDDCLFRAEMRYNRVTIVQKIHDFVDCLFCEFSSEISDLLAKEEMLL